MFRVNESNKKHYPTTITEKCMNIHSAYALNVCFIFALTSFVNMRHIGVFMKFSHNVNIENMSYVLMFGMAAP